MDQVIKNIIKLLPNKSRVKLNSARLYLKHSEWRELKECDLILSGFPRSGNTYFKAYFNLYQPEIKINNKHFHHKELFLYSIKNKIPTIILVRDPIDAIASYCVYQEGRGKNYDIINFINRYFGYCKALTEYSEYDSLLIIDFTELSISLKKVLLRINEKFDFDLKIDQDFGSIEESIFNHIKVKNDDMHAGSPLTIHSPNIVKKYQKEKITKLILESETKKLDECQKLYRCLIDSI